MKTSSFERIASDFVNGNLSDAKRVARGVSLPVLVDFFVESCGWSELYSLRVACYLKAGGAFPAGPVGV